MSQQDRLQVMRNHADHIEETTYEKDLTSEELDSKCGEFVDNSIKVSLLEDEFNEVKATHKGKVEPIKMHNKILQQEVKTKKQKVKGILFHMANQDSGYMETYEESGELIGTRRLRPEEKQARLFVSKPAANDQ